MLFGVIFVLVFFAALIAGCVFLLRSSAKQKRQWSGPSDMRRADNRDRDQTFDNERARRAAQDASNWGSPGW